jgi:hypothetical protein
LPFNLRAIRQLDWRKPWSLAAFPWHSRYEAWLAAAFTGFVLISLTRLPCQWAYVPIGLTMLAYLISCWLIGLITEIRVFGCLTPFILFTWLWRKEKVEV